MIRFLLILLISVGLSSLASAQVEYLDSIRHDGGFRTFIVHLPPSYNTGTKMPLEIVLHGGGNGGAQKVVDEHQFDEVGDTANYIAIFPNGLENSWADGRGTTKADVARVDDVGFLEALIDSLNERLSIDLDQVYICGGSNGGFMTQRMACQNSNKIAAFASIISNMSDSLARRCTPSRGVDMLLMSSTDDAWVPYEGGPMGGLSAGGHIVGVDSTVRFWLNNNQSTYLPDSITLPNLSTTDNGDVDVFSFPLGKDQSEVLLYRVNGAGHTVPGQLPNWNQIPLLGYVNRDIDGAEEVWKFFKRHKKSSSSSVGEHSLNEFAVIPNPSDAGAVLRLDSYWETHSIQIMNGHGQQVWSAIATQDQYEITTDTWKSGIYYVQVVNENGRYTKRLVVLHE